MTRDEIDARVVEIMIADGPDGHCDGHEVITEFVMSLLGKEFVAGVTQGLKNAGIDCGACWEVALTGVTSAGHTCPNPLLQCVDCKNTESPAGAMARHFNHGRCVRCGGWFKVVRA